MATWLDDIGGVKDIVDATGGSDVTLPRRAKMRFKGSFVVTDRPSDNLTEVDITTLESDLADDIAAAQADATQALSDASDAQVDATAALASVWTIGSAISGNTTLAGADKFTIRITSGSGNHAISVSGDGRHVAGDMIGILHRGTGVPTIAGTGGMTVNPPDNCSASFFDRGSFVLVLCESSTVCHLIGRLTPS